MNKEYLGKKRFYLNEHPETHVDARIYVVETRKSEYFSAVLEDGNAYMVELLQPLCAELPDIESFSDLDGRLFIEFPAKTIKHVDFYDSKSNPLGKGQLTLIKITNELFYIGVLDTETSFKYKCNGKGWDYTHDAGEHLVILMHPGKLRSRVVHCTSSIFWNNNTVEETVLINDYFQIHCEIPNQSI